MVNVKNRIIQRVLNYKTGQQTRTKGKRLYRMAAYDLKMFDLPNEKAVYEVENEFYSNEVYTVTIEKFNQTENFKTQCTCPQGWTSVCKHTVASLLALEQKLGYEVPPIKLYDQSDTEIYMPTINEFVLQKHCSREDWLRAKQLAQKKRAIITPGDDRNATATLLFRGETHTVSIQKSDAGKFNTSCTCSESAHKLCIHKAAVFLQIRQERGEQAFDLMRNWNVIKNKLLAPYGYTLEDDLEGKFDFKLQGEKMSLIVLDNSLVKLSELKSLGRKYKKKSFKEKTVNIGSRSKVNFNAKIEQRHVAYVFKFLENNDALPGFQIIPITGIIDEEKKLLVGDMRPVFERDNNGNITSKRLPLLDANDVHIFDLIDTLSEDQVANFAYQNTSFRGRYNWQKSTSQNQITQTELKSDALTTVQNYIIGQLKQLFALLQEKIVYYQFKENNQKIKLKNIQPLELANERVTLHFTLDGNEQFAQLSTALYIPTQKEFIPIKRAELLTSQLLKNNEKIYLIEDGQTLEELTTFTKRPILKVKRAHLPTLFKNTVEPLQDKFEVAVNIAVQVAIEADEVEPKAQIYLKESDDFLIIQPVVNYNNQLKELNGQKEITIYDEEKGLIQTERDADFELEFAEFVQQLHPDFELQFEDTEGLFYFLPYDSVMENLWFLDFAEQLRKRNVELFGFKQLSKFHYNVNKPELQIEVSSGIDWFDVGGEINFGDQVVSLKDVQKALIRNDRFVRLNDGTLGVLPDDWVQKYASLFKMGDLKGKKLRISKIHFSLVDELYGLIDDEQVQRELMDKRKRLQNFSKIESVRLPEKVTATLRDYQKEGFNWLNFLKDFHWGGCLADDMGLGKTLQVLTFLQKQIESQTEHQTNLIVAPTTLMFNWEAEIEKFCPQLTYHRHHGPTRSRTKTEIFEDYNLVITSYGILTSDIELFSKFEFEYVVLDESQAIKNPTTKRYKAARLLNAKNRIALTGTPIENNTFDLYAQMNFLNPGMLGSMEFFKQEFANPIDKHGDEVKVKALRKIVYPFILRRTKEMVAKELPPKTETVLYCEMKGQQRKVYEAFRNNYRFKILEKIDSEGMGKVGMYILEGLMKLRQICNSPSLLKDSEDYGTESVKLKELVKYIVEKTGQHKILIFSQFLGMLALIKNELEKSDIQYAYLDGSTSPTQRKDAVKLFQETESCRVFLMSLKAGSLGLNLTAADYVFLVDPWWNPAVEQQAIDRSHRIGQTKRVFAYKMICKDSVEEKILLLQDKKKALAADLISTEKGFLKNLNRNDVAFLFS